MLPQMLYNLIVAVCVRMRVHICACVSMEASGQPWVILLRDHSSFFG